MKWWGWAAAAGFSLTFPVVLDSCGGGLPPPMFVMEQRPAKVEDQFLKGKIGVLRPTLEPVYLIGAFRMLSGQPLTAKESAALYPAPAGFNNQPPAAYLWESVRKTLAGGTGKAVDPYKRLPGEGVYGSFLNCNDDAFDTARAALQSLEKEWGANDDRVLAWVMAQDQVFANCSATEPKFPEPPGPRMDPLLAAHRRYQLAAALFYGGAYRRAATEFLKIAEDRESPWWTLGRYLAARSLVRAAQFTADEAAHGEARALLESCLKDEDLAEWHKASRDLLAQLRLRIEPAVRVHELGAALMRPAADSMEVEEIRQTATDFIFLMERTVDYKGRKLTRQDYLRLEEGSELAAWVDAIMQSSTPGFQERTVEWWRKTHNAAWLIAALQNGPEKFSAELLAAAAKVDAASPAFESVSYYAALREAGRGHQAQARMWADRALMRRGLTESGRNLILRERLKWARSWDEFLTFSLRRAEDSSEWTRLPDGALYGFDEDAIAAFNSEIPLRLWVDASRNKALPAGVQLRVAESGWFRAILLGRGEEARVLMTRIVELNPAASVTAARFLAAKDDKGMRLGALYVYLRAPGLAPKLGGPWDEMENLGMAHVSRRCVVAPPESSEFPTFLAAADRDAARAEVKLLRSAKPWNASFVLRATLDWAASHPQDPLVPEALHRAVDVSHYGCGDEDTGKYSQQAYRLLHERYAKTTWAAETKYWYK